jgi:molybdopterin-guanine dinucleotide biosynthesis protein B
VLVASSVRWALMHELRNGPEPGLTELRQHISPCDLLLVEGFKCEPIPKLEVYRACVGEPHLFPNDSHIVAIAADRQVATSLPQFNLNDVGAIGVFIVERAATA